MFQDRAIDYPVIPSYFSQTQIECYAISLYGSSCWPRISTVFGQQACTLFVVLSQLSLINMSLAIMQVAFNASASTVHLNSRTCWFWTQVQIDAATRTIVDLLKVACLHRGWLALISHFLIAICIIPHNFASSFWSCGEKCLIGEKINQVW